KKRREAMPELRRQRSDRAAGVQPDVQDVCRRDGRRRRGDVSTPRDRAVYLRAVQERARYGAEEIAVWDRADREGVPQRDQPAELHFSLARISADGTRIFLPAGTGDGAARVLEGIAD